MSAAFPFEAERLVRFADCDPAGIVYFPRYFDFRHGALEDWFSAALSVNYWSMLRDRGLGLPAVRSECDFRRPSRMGDTLRIAVLVERVGGASLTTRFRLRCDDELRAEARLVQVTMPIGGTAAIPVPHDLRDLFEAYRLACTAASGAAAPPFP